MAAEIWVEKYRPKSINDYVFQNADMKRMVQSWIDDKATPSILLSGVAGTGKTSLAMMVLEELGIPKSDILFKNASRERKIDELQTQITNFAEVWTSMDNPTDFKYVVLDEAESLSELTQRFLRGEIERFHQSCRFILTCNYRDKIIPALHSRLEEHRFDAMPMEEFTVRVATILMSEQVNLQNPDTFAVMQTVIEKTYPDLRKAIGECQKLSVKQPDGTRNMVPPPEGSEVGLRDYLTDMVKLFKAGDYIEGRKLLISQAKVEEYVGIYRYFYQNLDLFGSTQEQMDSALLTIRRSLVNHSMVADAEINMAACLVELTMNAASS